MSVHICACLLCCPCLFLSSVLSFLVFWWVADFYFVCLTSDSLMTFASHWPLYILLYDYYTGVVFGQSSTPLNTFQVIMVTDGARSYAFLNYYNMTWYSANGGSATVSRHTSYNSTGIFIKPRSVDVTWKLVEDNSECAICTAKSQRFLQFEQSKSNGSYHI